MAEIKASPGDDILYGTSAADTFVFNDVSDYFMYPSASQLSYEMHVSSADGYNIIKNFDFHGDDRISSIDPETQNSEHLPIVIEVDAPGADTKKLYGTAGNDTLDGSGFYSDILVGGTGNDTYIVDNNAIVNGFISEGLGNDSIREELNEGIDTVESPAGYVLGDNLENLVLTGSNDSDGVGNALDNQIDGNVGKNFLVGGDGNDELRGNKGDDVLVGVAGKDTLTGGAGDDTLTGGAGADTFVLSSPFDGIDTIRDFKWEEGDKIQISAEGFSIEEDDYDSFIFDSDTNQLFFEQVVIGENMSSSSLSLLLSLQPGSNFNPNLDIDIVSSNIGASVSATD